MQPKAVIHRDIKPLNTLLCEKGLKLKICDFGTVVDLSQSISCNAGTCRYKAPEVRELFDFKSNRIIINQPTGFQKVLQGNKPDEKCDVYSWAITFWEILSRKEPFEQYNTLFELYMAINEGKRLSLDIIIIIIM